MANPVLLPRLRGMRIDKPRMLDWGGALTPPNGGVVQTLLRLGTRHAIDLTPPLLQTEPLGRTFGAQLRMAKLYGALVAFDQDGLNIGTPGAPVASGTAQTGSTLNMRGFTSGYPVVLGQAFSIIHGSRRYLHFAADNVAADALGNLLLPIFPMLRIVVTDADVCEFAQPYLQGSISGNEVSWQRLTAPYCDFGTITVTEDE